MNNPITNTEIEPKKKQTKKQKQKTPQQTKAHDQMASQENSIKHQEKS